MKTIDMTVFQQGGGGKASSPSAFEVILANFRKYLNIFLTFTLNRLKLKTVFSTSDEEKVLYHTERKRSISYYKDSSPSPATGVNRTQNDAGLVLYSPLTLTLSRKGRGENSEVFSTHSAGQRKAAFTLAEVLITLGIIGVVAAMTLPALLAKYQKQVTVNKTKKFYSVMSQVLERAKADNGDFNGWYYENSRDFYTKYIKPYMTNISSEQFNIHIYGDFVGGVRFVFADGTYTLFSISSNFAHGPIFIYYTVKPQYNGSTDNSKPQRERFYFKINEKGALVTPDMEKTREDNLKKCKDGYWKAGNTTTNNGAITCSTVIFKDGWQIKDDYPW